MCGGRKNFSVRMFVGQIVEITEEITLSKRKRCPQYPEEQYSGIIE